MTEWPVLIIFRYVHGTDSTEIVNNKISPIDFFICHCTFTNYLRIGGLTNVILFKVQYLISSVDYKNDIQHVIMVTQYKLIQYNVT